jgi:hypothetical protein
MSDIPPKADISVLQCARLVLSLRLRRIRSPGSIERVMEKKNDPFPDWPSLDSRFIDSAHLHALGQLTLVYNLLEEAFAFLFVRFLPTSKQFATGHYFELNNRKRVDLLAELVSSDEADEQVKKAVLAAIHGYDICTDNRNILAHSMISTEDHSGDFRRLIQRKSKSSRQFVSCDVPLSDLRRAADETSAYFLYVLDLDGCLLDRDHIRQGMTIASPRPLPEIPPRPRKLSQSQPVRGAVVAKSRPEPSRG